ncbi:MAG: hypothetical protein WDN03_02870 [Rhizomicrobium sp.]
MDETDAVNAAFSMPLSDGRFEGQLGATVHLLSLRKPSLILAFAPKAAGTFFRTAAILAIDGQLVRIGHAQGGRDVQPYLPTFIAYYLGKLTPNVLVAHAHMQALPANRHFIEALNLRPVVMLRAVPDMLASYWDMLESDPAARSEGLNCQIPRDFPAMARADKAEFMIDVLAPWYASYFASWLSYAQEEPARVCILDYRDFLSSPAGVLHAALKHAKVEQPMVVCQAALDRVWRERGELRFNQGVEGRGRSYFSPAQMERLNRLLAYYDIAGDVRATLMGA